MKIDLNTIDTENFIVRSGNISDEECYLVYPQHIGCKWNKHNLHFRSSIWSIDGELISAGFPKFANLGENPDVFGYPKSLANADILTKLDGSLLIVSRYKGQLIIRTRGTFDARHLENGYEIEALIEKYSSFFNEFCKEDTQPVSWLFEWLSPVNRIVVRYDELDMKLIGGIKHEDYSLYSQSDLDLYADCAGLKRPEVHTAESLDNLVETVKDWVGTEGVVVYTKGGIYKIKADDYLTRHRLKDVLRNFSHVVDFYFTSGMPDYQKFYNAVVEAVDWETAEEIRGEISRIVDGMNEVHKIVEYMKEYANSRKSYARKDAAKDILQSYGNTNRAAFVFCLLDGKELTPDHYKKLLYQVVGD